MSRTRVEIERPLDAVRAFLALRRDVLVLSVAMFAFSLGFQMTSRFLPRYMELLGASGVVVGLFGTVGNVVSAVYPYPGGAVSDRLGSRYSLTLFGLLSTVGFAVWLAAPRLGTVVVGPVVLAPWTWVFVGLLLAQAWKSFGLGATFAVVKQSTAPSRLAAGFATTETVRRVAFLAGPVLAAVLLGLRVDFVAGFRAVLAVAVVFGAVGTVLQHVLYDASEDTVGDSFAGLGQVREDVREMPEPLRPLLVGDALVRFANGMVYVFFVLVVTSLYEVGLETTVAVGPAVVAVDLSPEAFFGYLLGVEMLVALFVMVPAARLAERVGLVPVVAAGFAVYALFPVVLIAAPPTAAAMVAVFALSGLRFAGLPSHKALIVGPAAVDSGGRVTGTYYLVRNAVVIPSAALGGVLWEFATPALSFTVAAVIGLTGTAYFLVFGREFGPYDPAGESV